MATTLNLQEKDYFKRLQEELGPTYKLVFLSKYKVTDFYFIYYCVLNNFKVPCMLLTFTSRDNEGIRQHGGIETIGDDLHFYMQEEVIKVLRKFREEN